MLLILINVSGINGQSRLEFIKIKNIDTTIYLKEVIDTENIYLNFVIIDIIPDTSKNYLNNEKLKEIYNLDQDNRIDNKANGIVFYYNEVKPKFGENCIRYPIVKDSIGALDSFNTKGANHPPFIFILSTNKNIQDKYLANSDAEKRFTSVINNTEYCFFLTGTYKLLKTLITDYDSILDSIAKKDTTIKMPFNKVELSLSILSLNKIIARSSPAESSWNPAIPFNFTRFRISYFFSDHFGFTSGIDFQLNQVTFNETFIQFSYPSIDIENEEYVKEIEAQDINENIEIKSISAPLELTCRFRKKNHSHNIHGGIILNWNKASTKLDKGAISYRGYYLEKNCTLFDVDYLGFYDNVDFENRNYMIPINRFTTSFILGYSYDFSLYKNLFLYINGELSFDFIPLTQKNESYIISHNPSEYNSLVFSSGKLETSKFLLECGIKFKLKY